MVNTELGQALVCINLKLKLNELIEHIGPKQEKKGNENQKKEILDSLYYCLEISRNS